MTKAPTLRKKYIFTSVNLNFLYIDCKILLNAMKKKYVDQQSPKYFITQLLNDLKLTEQSHLFYHNYKKIMEAFQKLWRPYGGQQKLFAFTSGILGLNISISHH